MAVVSKLRDRQCELLLHRCCAGVERLFYALRTCPSDWFVDAQVQFDHALCFLLEKVVTASEPGFGDWQWRLGKCTSINPDQTEQESVGPKDRILKF